MVVDSQEQDLELLDTLHLHLTPFLDAVIAPVPQTLLQPVNHNDVLKNK